MKVIELLEDTQAKIRVKDLEHICAEAWVKKGLNKHKAEALARRWIRKGLPVLYKIDYIDNGTEQELCVENQYYYVDALKIIFEQYKWNEDISKDDLDEAFNDRWPSWPFTLEATWKKIWQRAGVRNYTFTPPRDNGWDAH